MSGPSAERILVVLPTWLGDAAMATPALRRLRESLPSAHIAGVARPGPDQLLAGLDSLDEIVPVVGKGVMQALHTGRALAHGRYSSALLLRNSFSSALTVRLAHIPRRVGTGRDGRSWLLTDRVAPVRADARRFAPVPALDEYLRLVDRFLGKPSDDEPAPSMALGLTSEQEEQTCRVLAQVGSPERYAVINPGANREDKRWPASRFAEVAAHLFANHQLRVLINASPAEADLARQVLEAVPRQVRDCVDSLAGRGTTIGSLKGVIRGAALLVTNDTGPRHIAACFGVPTVSLFGPTDPRWTTLPDQTAGESRREEILVADPTLPEELVADEHPQRCRIDRIETDRVIAAADRVLSS